MPGGNFESYADTPCALWNQEHLTLQSCLSGKALHFMINIQAGRSSWMRRRDHRECITTQKYLAEKGYHRYETSNYARPGENVSTMWDWTGVSYQESMRASDGRTTFSVIRGDE